MHHFFCMDHSWETLRWSKRHHLPITRTVKPANDRISSVGTPEFPQPQWLSPKQADSPNACWLKELLIQTEAALSPCAKCVSEARGRVWLCEWQPVVAALSTSAGLPSVTPSHSRPTQAAAQPPGAAPCSQGLVLVSRSPWRSHLQMFFLSCKHYLQGSDS